MLQSFLSVSLQPWPCPSLFISSVQQISFITGDSSDSCFRDAGRDKRERLCLDVMFGPVLCRSARQVWDAWNRLFKMEMKSKWIIFNFLIYSPGIIMHDQPLKCHFFLPFQISHHIRLAFIFHKNEGNNQKVENKVTGRVSVGVGRALLSH